MKIKEIANANGFDRDSFERFCFNCTEINLKGFMNAIDDSQVPKAIELYKEYLEYGDPKEEAASQIEVLCTTTNDFANAEIEAYLGTVSGADYYVVGGLLGEGLAKQSKLFNTAFSKAKERMFENALELGANAIVGLNHSLTCVTNGNMIVVVTGTAVRVKKKDN